jgi:FlaA1/EpsC-like NDP-sugar epimerase
MEMLSLIGRSRLLLGADISRLEREMSEKVANASFLVIGGAGSIGQATVREIFKRNPRLLHVVDISENNMVELVRDVRSTLGYGDGEFSTFAIDFGGKEFEALVNAGGRYDYVLNLSALKHVRSEKDPYTLMRLIEVNILNSVKTARVARRMNAKNYFCVSTDKAANPVNMMGASKRIMEKFLTRESVSQHISMARFANVAFSDGSLLHGFDQRFLKQQPISAPTDVLRYFIIPQEAGELCLLACLFGENRDIFFPKLLSELRLTSFADIARRYVYSRGFDPFLCETEKEARDRAKDLIRERKWPLYLFASDTSGEKEAEEFFTESEQLDNDRFDGVGVIKNDCSYDAVGLDRFLSEVANLRERGRWDKGDLLSLFEQVLPEFRHLETGKYLDGRM